MSNNLILNYKNFIKPNNTNNLLNKKKKTDDELYLEQMIIQPIKIDKGNKYKLNEEYNLLNSNKNKNLRKYWEERTNVPYKIILKDQDHKKKISSRHDLKVYQVSDIDKDEKKLTNDYDKYNKDKKEDNDQLAIKYSLSNEKKYIKDFEYKNKFVYPDKYNPKDHGDLKQDKIEYYKKEQEKIEKEKQQKDELFDLVDNCYLYQTDEKNTESTIETKKTNQSEIKKINNNNTNKIKPLDEFYEVKNKKPEISYYNNRQKKTKI